MKNEKTHLKNLYKDLQQILEITTEFYHRKENILHQKLTQEELKPHEKESMLSRVDGRTLQTEEELNLLRQKIAVREKKNHENWGFSAIGSHSRSSTLSNPWKADLNEAELVHFVARWNRFGSRSSSKYVQEPQMGGKLGSVHDFSKALMAEGDLTQISTKCSGTSRTSRKIKSYVLEERMETQCGSSK
ncbi:melanoma inhibitory activity protein 3 isoform X2 [Silurus meridionalis]|nr:melanoma inhibitory activity protein 3 isoform X2 [Silurus meridionalis]